nr:hypothetical protein BaRGS_002191 [Batillaria attramentaria]
MSEAFQMSDAFQMSESQMALQISEALVSGKEMALDKKNLVRNVSSADLFAVARLSEVMRTSSQPLSGPPWSLVLAYLERP